jgi:AsmA protein
MLSSLSGKLNLAVADGALEGVDLVYELQRAEALINRQAPAAATGPRRTPFQSMKMSATVDKGTLHSEDLDIALPVLKITGAGGMSLVEQSIDYQLQARIHEVPPPGAVDLGQLRGATIPLRISGTFSDPKVSADVAGLVTERAKKELDEKLDEEKDKLADKLKKKLFGN